MPNESKRKPLESDYDADPGRRQAIVRASEKYLTTQDVHPLVAVRFAQESPGSVLDVGAGEGMLGRELESLGLPWTPFDNSPNMLKSLPDHAIQGEAASLPFPDDSFDAAAALYMLYHLDQPLDAITECHRVLTAGGLFAAAAPSASDSPELDPIFRAYGGRDLDTFDSDNGPELIESVFGNVEIESWDGPYVFLPDDDALRLYCQGFGLSEEDAEASTDLVSTPLHLTKRGAIMFARKT